MEARSGSIKVDLVLGGVSMKRSKPSAGVGRDGEPSQRQLRVGEVLRHSLSDLFQRGDFRDPVLADTSITVTEVQVSPDLRNAIAFVMPLGGEIGGDVGGLAGANLIDALTRATPFLKSRIAPTLQLRRFPRLSFKTETAFDTSDKIDRLLRAPGVARDLGDDISDDIGDNVTEEAEDGA
jgi:ribosome-binding factor A